MQRVRSIRARLSRRAWKTGEVAEDRIHVPFVLANLFKLITVLLSAFRVPDEVGL